MRRFSLAMTAIAVMIIHLAGCRAEDDKSPALTLKPKDLKSSRPSHPYPLSGESYIIGNKVYFVLASAEGYSELGEASWYGRKFHGRQTSSLEAYDMHDLTAAHKILPIGTWVKVTNLENFNVVALRINDRGPFWEDRIIDLSYSAAKALGITKSGVAVVRLEVLNKVMAGVLQGRNAPPFTGKVRTTEPGRGGPKEEISPGWVVGQDLTPSIDRGQRMIR